MTATAHGDTPGTFPSARRTLRVHGAVTYAGTGYLRSVFPVSALAATVLGLAGLSLSELTQRLGHPDARRVQVDRRLCDAWFGQQVHPVGWEAPAPWSPLSAAFPTADGSWIRTHANAPSHRAALLRVLRCEPDREAMADAIRAWDAVALETAIVAAGGAAAALHSREEWESSEPGRSVASEPLIDCRRTLTSEGETAWDATPQAPLRGIRVLDLTRVIAGPACTQVLAGLGADVLRVDPPDWDEPAILPMVMAEKRSARVDATTSAGLDSLRTLLSGADVLVHGYRAGALDRLGLDAAERARLRPGLVEVAERGYGWTGPWSGRRGFDSLVQFTSGIAHAGMVAAGTGEPVSLPVQALDWATGYLAAAAALAGLASRLDDGRGSTWHLSLARTAQALQSLPAGADANDAAGVPAPPIVVTRSEDPQAEQARVVPTDAGDIAIAPSPLYVGRASLAFGSITMRLGVDPPEWAG